MFSEDMFYLAAPYSHESRCVIDHRMSILEECDAVFIKHGMHTVSPLSKHHSVIRGGLPGDWQFWQHYSRKLLGCGCTHMLVLMIDGWVESPGVTGEIEFCREHNIPITFLEPSAILNGSEEFINDIEVTKKHHIS